MAGHAAAGPTANSPGVRGYKNLNLLNARTCVPPERPSDLVRLDGPRCAKDGIQRLGTACIHAGNVRRPVATAWPMPIGVGA